MIRTSLTAMSIIILSACVGQTAAPEAAEDGSLTSSDDLKLVPIADTLEFPWGMAALPNGDLLVTEREGRLRLISNDTLVEAPLTGLPDDILVDGQGGLLGIALDPDFDTNRRLYLSYSKNMGETNTTAVIAATLADDASGLTDVDEIFVGQPRETTFHYGSRLAFLPDGSLIITLGDGFWYMTDAQNPYLLHGKIACRMARFQATTHSRMAPATHRYGPMDIATFRASPIMPKAEPCLPTNMAPRGVMS